MQGRKLILYLKWVSNNSLSIIEIQHTPYGQKYVNIWPLHPQVLIKCHIPEWDPTSLL